MTSRSNRAINSSVSAILSFPKLTFRDEIFISEASVTNGSRKRATQHFMDRLLIRLHSPPSRLFGEVNLTRRVSRADFLWSEMEAIGIVSAVHFSKSRCAHLN